jgi:hypothetical protein
MAQRSEDGVGKTREESKRLERAKPNWTRSAISIQASGRMNSRIKRPDTRKHLNLRTSASRKLILHPSGRPHTTRRMTVQGGKGTLASRSAFACFECFDHRGKNFIFHGMVGINEESPIIGDLQLAAARISKRHEIAEQVW